MNPRDHNISWILQQMAGPLWLAIFMYLALTGATTREPHPLVFVALAVAGHLYFAISNRPRWRDVLKRHGVLLGALHVMALIILVSEALAWRRPDSALVSRVPVQTGLVLCLAPLVLWLKDERLMRWTLVMFVALCIWHFFALPVEAIWGAKLGWHPVALLTREAWPMRYQAAGLSLQVYFYVGLFLPMFYLAWGPLYERRLPDPRFKPPKVLRWTPALWLVPTLCLQSRSALASSLAASMICIGASTPDIPSQLRRWWLPCVVLAGLTLTVYLYMFAENKSGIGLRWAYATHYVTQAVNGPEVWTGHGFRMADSTMLIEGLTPVGHSHNDLIQVLYSWGLLALAAYLIFWGALLKLVYMGFVRHGEYWPLAVLVALVPNMVTDLGFHLYEKVVCLLFFAAVCMVYEGARERTSS